MPAALGPPGGGPCAQRRDSHPVPTGHLVPTARGAQGSGGHPCARRRDIHLVLTARGGTQEVPVPTEGTVTLSPQPGVGHRRSLCLEKGQSPCPHSRGGAQGPDCCKELDGAQRGRGEAVPGPGARQLRATSCQGWGHSQGRRTGIGTGRTDPPACPQTPLTLGAELRAGGKPPSQGDSGDRQGQLWGHPAEGTGTQCPPAAPHWCQGLTAGSAPLPTAATPKGQEPHAWGQQGPGTALLWGWHPAGQEGTVGQSK